MSTVILIGNGLSLGFDASFAGESLKRAALDRLGPAYEDVLVHIGLLGTPESPVADTAQQGFESLAGPLDRIAEALRVIETLPPALPLADAIRSAAEGVREVYLRVVGSVAVAIDELCRSESVGIQRSNAWKSMFAFAHALYELHDTMGPLSIFTLNYDVLLDSALIQEAKEFAPARKPYDGYRGGGSLNWPLDSRNELCLYHLHGSIGWLQDADQSVVKRRLENMRTDGVFESWARGDTGSGLPVLIMSDLKSPGSSHHPFARFYDELGRELATAGTVVVAGYGFGDRPVNTALAGYLTRRGSSVVVWSRHPSVEEVHKVLLNQDVPGASRITPDQIRTSSVLLPDADALRRLLPQ